jgi:hypothetical protein
MGMFVGSIATLSIQCWRRRRELRYMSKVSKNAPATDRKTSSLRAARLVKVERECQRSAAVIAPPMQGVCTEG